MNHVGEYLKKCREKAGATQAEVSRFLGYDSAQFISNVERELCGPPLETVNDWCECVGANKKLVQKLMIKHYEDRIGECFK